MPRQGINFILVRCAEELTNASPHLQGVDYNFYCVGTFKCACMYLRNTRTYLIIDMYGKEEASVVVYIPRSGNCIMVLGLPSTLKDSSRPPYVTSMHGARMYTHKQY